MPQLVRWHISAPVKVANRDATSSTMFTFNNLFCRQVVIGNEMWQLIYSNSKCYFNFPVFPCHKNFKCETFQSNTQREISEKM